jgi:1-acyl-sn-glycerol-3-phosphate acyltransferase
MLPPRIARRVVLAPLVVVVCLAFIALSPALAGLALIAGLLVKARPRPMRSLRLTGFALAGATTEVIAVLGLLGLWIASGFGIWLRTEPWPRRHYAFVRWFLDLLYAGAARTYGLRIEVDEPEPTLDERIARLTRPVIVLSRHAGPGDSLLLVRELLTYGRRPRIVMKAALQLDPTVDALGHRLPNVFIEREPSGDELAERRIERLAEGLDEHDALVIFPEGANWTPRRRGRGIRWLERHGRRDLARRARQMPNMLPPRPGGALAAIRACPGADVIFVAHAGLDMIVSAGDVWSKLPIDQLIRARWWRVPASQVPRTEDHEAQVTWLYDWWGRIDAWVSANRPGDGAAAVT